MIGFIQYFEQKTEETKNLEDTLSKLPDKYTNLLQDFEFNYSCKNTLKGDDKHIGFIKGNDIKVTAPWNYGREFTTLHEIAHLIWEKLINKSQKTTWEQLCKKHYHDKPKMNCEEVFCMVFASAYANHPITTYDIPALKKFVKSLERS